MLYGRREGEDVYHLFNREGGKAEQVCYNRNRDEDRTVVFEEVDTLETFFDACPYCGKKYSATLDMSREEIIQEIEGRCDIVKGSLESQGQDAGELAKILIQLRKVHG